MSAVIHEKSELSHDRSDRIRAPAVIITFSVCQLG